MTNALKAVDTALENCKKIQADFDLYKTQKPYKTNADFVKLDSQWNTLFRQYLTVSNYLSQLTAAADAALALSQKQQSFEGLEKVNDLQLKQVETLKQREKIAETVNSVNDKMAEIKNKAIETEAKKLNAAKSKLITAQTRAKIAGISLAAYPAAGDCFEDFSPIITQKTRTDSDGKFTISYSRDKIFTIFVRAQRAVLNATETYYWLIDASTNSKPAQVLLSNNNLAFIDPDGYFKVKPKEMSQDN